MEGTLGAQTVLAEEVAMIGGENDQCVIRQSEFVEAVDDTADVFVHQAHHAVVDGHILVHRVAVAQV